MMQSALTRQLVELDIKPPHLDILVNLYRFEGISQQELARRLLVGRSNVSMTLPQMEKRRLIERRPDAKDKRILRLFLTVEGRDVAEKAMAIQTALIERTLSSTPLDQCLAMADALGNVIEALQADAGEEVY